MSRRLGVDVALLSLVQLVNIVIPFLTIPFLAKVLEIEAFGAYVLCFSILQYIVLVSEYGFNLSGTRSITLIKDDFRRLSIIFWAIMIGKMILFTGSVIVLLLIIKITGLFENLSSEIKIGILFLIGTISYPQWTLQALGMTKEIAISSVVGKICLFPLFYIFVHSSADLDVAIGIYGLSVIITSLVGIIFLVRQKKIYWIVPEISTIIREFRLGAYIFASSVGTNIYSSSVVVFLGLISGTSEVALFAIADKIRQGIQMLFVPLQQALYPRMSMLMSKNISEAENIIKKILVGIAFIGILIAIVLFYLSEWLISNLFGDFYKPASLVLSILSVVPLLTAISGLLGVQILTAGNHQRLVFLAVFAGAIVCLIVIYPLILEFGAAGAALTVLISELTIAFLIFAKVMRENPNIFKF